MIKGCGHYKPAIDSIQIINVEENKTTKERITLSGQKILFFLHKIEYAGS